MKKILISVFILFNLSVSAQTNISDLHGICELKIRQTTTDHINKLLVSQKRKLIKLKDQFTAKPLRLKYFIYEIQIDTTDFTMTAPKITNHRIFILGEIELCNDYAVSKCQLDFYNDTLFDMKFENSTFSFDFEKKYGLPKYETRVFQNKCDLSNGDHITFNDETLIENWDNGDIHACQVFSKERDRKTCNVTTTSHFSIYDRAISSLVKTLEDHAYEKIKFKKENDSKKKLEKL